MATVLAGAVLRGTTADFVANGQIVAWDFTSAGLGTVLATGQIKHVYVHPKVANASLSTLNCAIYANNAGVPGTRLTPEMSPALGATTGAIPGGTTSAGLIRYDLATPLSVTSGDSIHIALRNAGEQFDWQGDAGNQYREKAGASLPDPWDNSGVFVGTNRITIFATDAPIPQVVAESVLADTGNTTTHNVPFPSPAGGILAGDLLVAVCGIDGSTGVIDWPTTGGQGDAGWTEIFQGAGSTAQMQMGVAYMRAAGGESGTFAVATASEGGGWRVLCIRGAHATTAPEVATASSTSGGSTNPNPPLLNPANWATPEPWLEISVGANDGNVAITAGNTAHVDFGNTRWANTAGAGVATAWRLSTDDSVDPGTFTMVTEQWLAATIGVRGAEPVAGGQNVAVAQATESDSAFGVAKSKTKAVALATSTDTAQPITRRKVKIIGQAVESDTAQAIARNKTRAVALASEADTSQAETKRKAKTTGLPTEADLAQGVIVSRNRNFAIGQATEADSATLFSIYRARSAPVGTANETDSALSITKRKTKAVEQAQETDVTQPTTGRKLKTLGLASSSNVAQPVGRIRSRAIGLASEANIGQAEGKAKSKALFGSQETDTAQSTTRRHSRILGLVTENDSAQVILRIKRKTLGLTTETDTAQGTGKSKRRVVTFATETDTGRQIVSPGRLGVSLETDAALGITRIKTKATGFAIETDSALTVTKARGRQIGMAIETDTSNPTTRRKTKPVTLASEIDLGLAQTRRKTKAVTQASETDVSQIVRRVRLRILGVATEVDSTFGLSKAKIKSIAQANTIDSPHPSVRIKSKLIEQALEIDEATPFFQSGVVPLNPAFETDSALPIVKRKIRHIGLAIELDQAVPLIGFNIARFTRPGTFVITGSQVSGRVSRNFSKGSVKSNPTGGVSGHKGLFRLGGSKVKGRKS